MANKPSYYLFIAKDVVFAFGIIAIAILHIYYLQFPDDNFLAWLRMVVAYLFPGFTVVMLPIAICWAFSFRSERKGRDVALASAVFVASVVSISFAVWLSYLALYTEGDPLARFLFMPVGPFVQPAIYFAVRPIVYEIARLM